MPGLLTSRLSFPNSLLPYYSQKIHRALNMGTEERKSQQLKLEQRYSWDC